VIEARELSKSYGGVEAVRSVTFSAETGSVLGLLGPNGAGKTTIMKILTGYHFPSSGIALVDGVDVTEDPLGIKRRVGYLPESVPLYQDMTPSEYLDFAADARGLEGPARVHAKARAVEACGLGPVYARPVEQLSKGYRQRLGLAQAILHDPPILILDEPTTGLDPNQIIEIRSLIRELGTQKTVILSTHILQEVEAICSSVVILNEGRIVAQGEPGEIGEALKGEERIRLLRAQANPGRPGSKASSARFPGSARPRASRPRAIAASPSYLWRRGSPEARGRARAGDRRSRGKPCSIGPSRTASSCSSSRGDASRSRRFSSS
jgi:ABC-2 type transport system ATP-binding protein